MILLSSYYFCVKIAFDDITDIGEPFDVMELERRFNSFGCLLFNNFNACAADDGLVVLRVSNALLRKRQKMPKMWFWKWKVVLT